MGKFIEVKFVLVEIFLKTFSLSFFYFFGLRFIFKGCSDQFSHTSTNFRLLRATIDFALAENKSEKLSVAHERNLFEAIRETNSQVAN